MGGSGNPATQASPGLHDYRECSRRTGVMFTSGQKVHLQPHMFSA